MRTKREKSEEWLTKGTNRLYSWHLTEGEERKGQKYHEETLSYFDKAIKFANGNTKLKTQAWYYKAQEWEHMAYVQDWKKCSCYDEAIKCYEEAINLDENYAPAWHTKGYILDKIEKTAEAIKCYDKAIQLDKDNDQYKVSKMLILFKTKKEQEAINLLLETKLDLLEKLSNIENKQNKELLFSYLTKSEKFEDDYFRKIMEEHNITDNTQKNIYREIYAQSLLLISYLFVSSGEKFVHYTKNAVAQKLLFDTDSKFRLSMSTLSNDSKEGKTLFDYLELQSEYKRKKSTEKSITFIGNTILESKGSNNNGVGEEYRAFIGCFSFNTDCLNQFRLYGKDGEKEGTGVSMVFNNGSFPHPKTPTSSTDKCNSLLYRCMYLDSETGRVVSIGHQEEYMRTKENSNSLKSAKFFSHPLEMDDPVRKPDKNYLESISTLISNVQTEFDTLKGKITDELDKSIVSQLLINLRHLTKDVAFKEEQECRIIQIVSLMDDRVMLREDYNQVYVEINLNYVEKIIFGPKSIGMDLFQDILRKKGLDINCEQSTLPLA
ncbi:MAG: tetratricopeptide repeat protein [Candidatus Symbiothrix sp.]|jgi:tetratricopeptide (TPR) repeat protein|nr:tetratricopeptide repeat protein [Candidatus Symbiothrix sp.]